MISLKGAKRKCCWFCFSVRRSCGSWKRKSKHQFIEMTSVMGLLRIKVIRGINLVIRDLNTSDPYVIITMGSQKVKTRHIKNDCNPSWDDEVSLAVFDLDAPISLSLHDLDMFTDDGMGDAQIDINPYVENVKAGLDSLPTGTVVDEVHPTSENCLSDTSQIVWKDGKLVQDMVLRLKNVESGKVEIQLEWVHVPGSGLLDS